MHISNLILAFIVVGPRFSVARKNNRALFNLVKF